jgi:hypothetical protein
MDMNIPAAQGNWSSKKRRDGKFSMFVGRRLWTLILSIPFTLWVQAQELEPIADAPSGDEVPEEQAEVIVTLPDSTQMALALATRGSREQALLDVAAAANVLSRIKTPDDTDAAVLAQNFMDARGWLQMLVERYGWVQPRSSILDPAAWLVLMELQQHDLENEALVFPGHTPEAVLIYQVFQRFAQRLAAANLPVLLLELEPRAVALWDRFLQVTGTPEDRDPAWKEVELSWFTGRQFPLPEDMSPELLPLLEDIPLAMSKLALSAVDARPPDSVALQRLRYTLLSEAGKQAENEDSAVRDLLYLAGLIDGLHDGQFFEFVQGLLAVTSGLLENSASGHGSFLLVDWLVAELPAISTHYAAEFADVDPWLNTAMGAAFDVLQDVAGSNTGEAGSSEALVEAAITADPAKKTARAALADAIAQMALLIPDMGYYFNLPVRARIIEELNICISIAASRDETGNPAITRSQFDACMETMVTLADEETRLPELAGNINGPFTPDTLQRELNVPPWQRINYAIGYLHRRYSTTCQPPATALANPLEWAVLATAVSWFAEHFPEFFYTPENETRLTKIRSTGEQLVLGMAEQAECIAATGSGATDLVSRSITDYELALRELDSGIENAEVDFRNKNLRPGADVSLKENASQNTAYRPDDLVIAPCDTRNVCEMSGSLSTTRALIGLFPDEFLIAEQAGMGQIEICYKNMEWVQRRSELVRADDENVANYFGRLGFDLMGRYLENGEVHDIFGFRFTSPEEYHYLFAQTSGEVLADSCPVEWVGSRVVTPLRESRGGIVPDRLTYLAASRSLPSRLLQNNWDKGAEWRDWFVTGIGVSALDLPPAPEIGSRLNQHLQNLYQAEQAEVYQRVLLPNARDSEGNDVSLFSEMLQVSISKALIRMHMMLFYPGTLSDSDPIRMSIVGDAGLLDGRALRRFREGDVALTSVSGIARQRLDQLRAAWLEQPQAVRRQGSIPASLVYALTRTNALYRQFFTHRSESLQGTEDSAEPQAPVGPD